MAWRLLRALVLCTHGLVSQVTALQTKTHFGCKLAARFGPAACIARGSPKECRSEPSPVPSPGLAFVCPLYEPSIRRRVRGLPDTLRQVRQERLFQPSWLAHTTVRSPEVGNIRNRATSVRVSWRPYHAAPSSRLYKATGASSAPGARGRADGALLHQSSHLLHMTGCLCPACFREAPVEFGRTAPCK